jgi:transposase
VTPQGLDSINPPADLAECQKMIGDLVATLKQAIGRLDEKDEQIEELQQRLQLLLRSRFGRQSESLDADQLRLFADENSSVAQPEQPEAEPAAAKVNGVRHGRRKPAKSLPRRRVVHELSQEERCCPGCGEERTPIGEEVSERYGYIPSCVEVIEDVRVRYACGHCQEHVVIAGVPSKPIPKGLADSSMLAYIATSKYADHLPLNRLEGIFLRHGAEIARSTMCDWMGFTAVLLTPIYERMKERILQSRIIWTDDTPVDLQDRDHEDNIRKARIWAYLGDANNNLTVYDFTDSRKRDGPVNFLKNYKGFLQADAYAGYDGIYAGKLVHEVACWAHARRKFFEALTSNKAAASWALRCIQILYRIEKRLSKSSLEKKLAIRQSRSQKVLAILKSWLDRNVLIESKGPLAKAIRYTLNQWNALCTFTEDSELTIDNNKAERAMRAIAVGRKNWLFAGSRDGGKRAAILCSLVASCKQHGVDPLAYLTDVLNKMSSHHAPDIDSLTPDKWSPAT